MNNLQLRKTFPVDSSLFRSRIPNSESCVHFYSAYQLTPVLLTRLSQSVATDIFLSFIWHNRETIGWVAQITDVYLPDLETAKTWMLELWFLWGISWFAGGCLLIVLEERSGPPPLLQLFLLLFLFLFLILFFSFSLFLLFFSFFLLFIFNLFFLTVWESNYVPWLSVIQETSCSVSWLLRWQIHATTPKSLVPSSGATNPSQEGFTLMT